MYSRQTQKKKSSHYKMHVPKESQRHKKDREFLKAQALQQKINFSYFHLASEKSAESPGAIRERSHTS